MTNSRFNNRWQSGIIVSGLDPYFIVCESDILSDLQDVVPVDFPSPRYGHALFLPIHALLSFLASFWAGT